MHTSSPGISTNHPSVFRNFFSPHFFQHQDSRRKKSIQVLNRHFHNRFVSCSNFPFAIVIRPWTQLATVCSKATSTVKSIRCWTEVMNFRNPFALISKVFFQHFLWRHQFRSHLNTKLVPMMKDSIIWELLIYVKFKCSHFLQILWNKT